MVVESGEERDAGAQGSVPRVHDGAPVDLQQVLSERDVDVDLVAEEQREVDRRRGNLPDARQARPRVRPGQRARAERERDRLRVRFELPANTPSVHNYISRSGARYRPEGDRSR